MSWLLLIIHLIIIVDTNVWSFLLVCLRGLTFLMVFFSFNLGIRYIEDVVGFYFGLDS